MGGLKVYHLVVDRIEEGIAVLLTQSSGKEILVPASLLPNVAEGQYLKVTWEVDTQATDAAKQRVKGLLKQVFKEE